MRVARIFMFSLVCCQTDLQEGQWFPSPGVPSKSELAAKDDETCQGYGAKPGTEIYIRCRMQREQTRDAGDNAIAAAAAGALFINNPVPASDAPALRKIIPPPTRCRSMRIGAAIQTVCN
jgi:hypothetical protein